MSNGIGTSKEDKRRKRRSLPHEKALQASQQKLKKIGITEAQKHGKTFTSKELIKMQKEVRGLDSGTVKYFLSLIKQAKKAKTEKQKEATGKRADIGYKALKEAEKMKTKAKGGKLKKGGKAK